MVVRQGAVAVKETTPGMGPSSTTKHGKIEIHPVSVTIDQAEFAEMDTVVSSAAQCEEWTNSVKEQIRKTPELKILLDTMQTGDDARLYFASSKRSTSSSALWTRTRRPAREPRSPRSSRRR